MVTSLQNLVCELRLEMGCFSLFRKYTRLCTNNNVHFGVVNILTQERGASVLHRLNPKKETSQENESNITRKPVKDRLKLKKPVQLYIFAM